MYQQEGGGPFRVRAFVEAFTMFVSTCHRERCTLSCVEFLFLPIEFELARGEGRRWKQPPNQEVRGDGSRWRLIVITGDKRCS